MKKALIYQELDGSCPVLEFLAEQSPQVRAIAFGRIRILKMHGHKLRRPHAAYLGDGIYELRWRVGQVQYRILYAFHGTEMAVLLHAIAKEGRIPFADLERALTRQGRFKSNPERHADSRRAL